MSLTTSDLLATEQVKTPRQAAADRALPQHAALATLGLILCILFSWMFLQTLLHRERVGSTDFLQEWTSARNWATGRPIYARLSETLPVYFGPNARSVVDLNAHPPTAVVLALPFSLLPYQEAWLWWNAANLAALVGGLWMLIGKRGLDRPPVAWIPLGLLVLSSNALKEQVQLGQLNGWLLLLLTAAWCAHRRGRSVTSGACLGAAAAIKLFPGFVVLYFLARRDWKACCGAAGMFAVLTVLTAGLLGPSAFGDYVTHVLPSLQQYRTAWLNASLVGFWSKLLVGQPERMIPLFASPVLARVAIVASWSLVVGVVIWLAGRARSRTERDVAFAVTTIGMLLVCPITWDHYFLLAVPAIAILWTAADQLPWSRVVLVLLAVILLTIRPGWIFGLSIPGPGEFADLLGLPAPLVMPQQAATALAYQFYAATALFALAVFTFVVVRRNYLTAAGCVR